jgi:outer membrane protein assembly factor BamB
MQGFQGAGGDDAMGGVYVRDSAIAMEKLALAQRMERLHEWSKSADVYQEILDKYQDRVVPTHTDELTQAVDRYASVTETVRESLCKWPQEGLLVYRGRYETIAQGLLTAAGNDGVDKLHEILAKYFPTEAAKTAGIRLMDLCFEEGDYAEVNQIGKELLEWHPDLVAERPMVIYRTALAAKLANQPQDVQRYETQLRNQFPQATGIIRGQQVVLADSLEKELASATVVRAESPDSWPMVGGNVERSQICMSLVKPGARLYNILVTKFNWEALQETADRDNREHASDEQRKKGIGLGIMPAVDKGELFYQDNTRIYALDLDSGVPLPQWVDTYPMQNGAFTPAWSPAPTPVPLGRQLCVTVTDKYVAAVMGLSDPLSSSDPLPGQDSHLVCLDRKSGKELWETSPHDFSDAQLALRELRMGGSPLIVGDNLYVIVHGMKGQFEDCYVVCYAAATGQLRWATFIANSNGDNLLEAGGIGSYLYSDAVSHLAYSAGRLFVITNLGAVASLDAYTGTIAWLNIYRTESTSGSMYNFPQRIIRQIPPEDDETPTAPWVYNPAVVQDGKVFVMPSDGHDLLVYDAASGDLVKHIWLTDLQEERDPNVPSTPDLPTTLLAVKGDMVYLAGERQVWQVPWQLIPHDASKVDSIPGYWRSTEGDQDPSAQDKADDDQLVEIRGRAFVTGDAVYVPTEKYLLRIQLASGLLDSANSTFPKNGWESGKEGPGNVIATQDHLIVAGDENIAVYTDIAMAQAKLNREIAEAPASPDARLHYAEVMYAAAQPDAAQQRLEEGFELLGGTQSLRSGATRDRAFNDALSFARRSEGHQGETDRIERFFDLAQAAALSTAQQVSYRLARAEYDWKRDNRDAASAIELYQEILGEPTFRAVPMPDPHGNATIAAGDVADQAIKDILGTPDGVLAYKKFEEAAAQKLAAAQAAQDPDRLLDISRVYPNSAVARDAMLAAANCYETRGDARMATQVLRQILARFKDQTQPAVLVAMARNYLKLPNHLDVAVSRLQLAAVQDPTGVTQQPMTLPDGSVLPNMPITLARDALMRYEVEASLQGVPDLHLPTHEQSQAFRQATGRWARPFVPASKDLEIQGVDAMIVPMEDFSRGDRVIAWSGGSGLTVYPAGSNKALFACAAISQQPVGAAWVGDKLIVWSRTSVSQLDGTSGKQLWDMDTSSLPPILDPDNSEPTPPEVDMPGGPEEVLEVKPVAQRVIVSTSTGRLLAVDPSAGHIAWQTRVTGLINPLLANDDFTVIRTQDGQSVEIVVYNSFTGELLGRKQFGVDTQAYPINLALAADGTLAYTLPNQLCIKDLFEANLSPTGMDSQNPQTPAPDQPQIFLNAARPEPHQLLIHSGRVFAIANSGKDIRIFSVDNGEPWQYRRDYSPPIDCSVLPTQSTSGDVQLYISGNYLFALSPRSLIAYRLDPPGKPWEASFDATKVTNYQQLLFGRDYLGLVDRPNPPATESNRPGNRVTLNFFLRRAKDLPDEESGLLIFDPEFQLTEDNLQLQAVDGGVAFFTGRRIQFLMGAREALGNLSPI